jgi:hypothetical protein
VFARLKRKAKGFRTFIGAGAIGVVGVLGAVGDVDLTPIVQLFVKDPAALPVVMVLIAIFFGVMRQLTDSAPGGSNSAWQSAPTFKGVDDGE